MSLSSRRPVSPLPDGWMLCQSKSVPGKKYYFDRKTGTSSWSKPQPKLTAKKKRRDDQETSQNYKDKPPEGDGRNLKRRSGGYDDRKAYESAKRSKPSHSSHNSGQRRDDRGLYSKHTSKSHYKSNIASTRMTLLRSQMAKELEKERSVDSVTSSSVNTYSTDTPANQIAEYSTSKEPKYREGATVSPNLSQSHSSENSFHNKTNIPKSAANHRSPNDDSKSSNASLNPYSINDSAESSGSPSRFFAANKILSSIKAQLAEEYSCKPKPPSNFSVIEEGICKQTIEYSSINHPATPPQFSQASKLVSAIKSRLASKIPKETQVHSSANNRLAALRNSLSEDLKPEHPKQQSISSSASEESVPRQYASSLPMPMPCYRRSVSDEAMEVEENKEIKIEAGTAESRAEDFSNLSSSKAQTSPQGNFLIVVDTNIFMHEIHFLKGVLDSFVQGYGELPTLFVPWRVINELDKLKDNNNGSNVKSKQAKAAMDFLYQSLPENHRIKGQSLRDANSHIYPCELPDDEILNCCLQQAERGSSVMLLSNDKNLCNKAVINSIRAFGQRELQVLLKRPPEESEESDTQRQFKQYEGFMFQLLSNILENEMRAKYNTMWLHVVLKTPPWTLRDVLQCLLKHWIAVFSEVFPRIEQLIKQLNTELTRLEERGSRKTHTDVERFKNACVEVASKCQIIPEYMELAKLTLERLNRKPRAVPSTPSPDNEAAVVEAFENIWTVLSSYCAKLSSMLGIDHRIEDKLAGDETSDSLISKWPVFSHQIHSFTVAIEGALSVLNESDPMLDEQMVLLESVFKECLSVISYQSSSIGRDDLRIFCLNHRSMLQEALNKFAELMSLVDLCRDRIVSK